MLLNAETIQSLYAPVSNKPMHVVVFGSGSGTNIEALLKAQKEFNKNSLGYSFEIKALFTDRQCRVQEIGVSAGIPVIYHSFAKFFQNEGITDHQDPSLRQKYDEENVRLLLKLADKHLFNIDIILLAGYMRLVFPPLLKSFRNKILNIHPADLTKMDSSGNRIYTGGNAVFNALKNGERQTRTSVILVDERVDTGPILVSGPWVSYEEGYPLTERSVHLHQNKQKIHSDWPACIKAMSLIAQGRVGIDQENNVYLDGLLQQVCGYEMK